MKTSFPPHFKHQYELYCKHLKLKGLQSSTIDSYSRGIRRIGAYFNFQLDNLTLNQLVVYFYALLGRLSWSTVKLDLYGLKFFYTYVLQKEWVHVPLVKPPKAVRIPDIVTVDEAQRLFMSTNKLSYRVFFFTLYSMGLRLSEGLALEVDDIDAHRMRVHIRDSKGNKDRFVPLPEQTLLILRRFWVLHHHPRFLFPNRKRGLKLAHLATTTMNRGGVQVAIKHVVHELRLKKRYHATA